LLVCCGFMVDDFPSLLCDCWPLYHLPAIVQLRQKYKQDQATANQNSMPPTRISHATFKQVCLERRMEYTQWRCLFWDSIWHQ
jgi:hypothetical protein